MNRYWVRTGTASLLATVRSAVARQSMLAPRLWVACVAAALAGVINAAAFPDLGWWPLVIPGTALMLWSLRARRAGGAFLVGLIGGFTFFGTHIFWLTVYLGPVPWLALAGLESVFFALGAMLMALAWRTVPRCGRAGSGVWCCSRWCSPDCGRCARRSRASGRTADSPGAASRSPSRRARWGTWWPGSGSPG